MASLFDLLSDEEQQQILEERQASVKQDIKNNENRKLAEKEELGFGARAKQILDPSAKKDTGLIEHQRPMSLSDRLTAEDMFKPEEPAPAKEPEPKKEDEVKLSLSQPSEDKDIKPTNKPIIPIKESIADTKTMVQSVKAAITPDLPNADRFDQELKKLEELRTKAQARYMTDKSNVAWASVFANIGKALAQLGAGIYGLKNNVDMSGVKFDKADWANAYQSAKDDLDLQLGLIDKQESGILRQQSLAQRLAEKAEQQALEEKRIKEGQDFQREMQKAGIQGQKEIVGMQQAGRGQKPEGLTKEQEMILQSTIRANEAKQQRSAKSLAETLQAIDKQLEDVDTASAYLGAGALDSDKIQDKAPIFKALGGMKYDPEDQDTIIKALNNKRTLLEGKKSRLLQDLEQ